MGQFKLGEDVSTAMRENPGFIHNFGFSMPIRWRCILIRSRGGRWYRIGIRWRRPSGTVGDPCSAIVRAIDAERYTYLVLRKRRSLF
jgi:hypothetical protein